MDSNQNSRQPVYGSRDAFGYLRYPVYPAGSFHALFFWYIIALVVLTSVNILGEVLSAFFPPHEIIMVILALPQIVLSVIVVCYWAYLLYRSWAVIQDGERVATTPGLAVGLTFIPFFNCYWSFVSQLGLAKGMNTYCRQRNIHAPVVNENIAIINSCMTTVWYVWWIIERLIASIGRAANQGEPVLPPLSVFFIYVCLILIWFVLEYILYNQYAHVAEAIQVYKRSQDTSIERR
jgi:hypothetical protein